MSSRPEQDLALALAAAVRTAAYYGPDNAVLKQNCALLLSMLEEALSEDGSLTVAVHSHCVFVGKRRIRTTVATHARFAHLIGLYASWQIEALTFLRPLSEPELAESIVVLATEGERSSEFLRTRFEDRGVTNVQVDLLGPGKTHPVTVSPVVAYAACVQLGEGMLQASTRADAASGRQLRHVTQAVVDQILEDPHSLIALTSIKEFDRYLISHSTNVAILSVVLGQRLGLSKARLGELCLAAFLHDAGKLEVDPDIVAKPGSLDEDEWREMRRHPVLAAHALLDELHTSASGMRAVVVAFEHHLHYDMTGYPATRLKQGVTLFGSIVAIADVFDAMTTARPYRRRNFTPYEALDHIVRNSGTLYDPILVKLFGEIMGLYPSGTMVHLTTEELAVVCEPPAVGKPLDRPRVKVLHGGEPGRILDLCERLDGEFLRSVKRVLNPANMGLIPAVDVSVFENVVGHPAANQVGI